MNPTYAAGIISGLEKNLNKNEEAQLDFIVEQLQSVPKEEHEEVMFRCAAYMTLTRATKMTNWFAEAEAEEAAADARFVAMNERDWREAQQQAKRYKWFGSWDRWVAWARRVDGKRREKAVAVRVVKKEVDKVAQLLEERRDVQRYPHSYGSEQDCERLIGEYEQMICAIPTGKWRLCLVKQEESKALQPRIDEIVRQVKLTMGLRKLVAVKRIQALWREHESAPSPKPSISTDDEEEDEDDNKLPRDTQEAVLTGRSLFNVVRRTHDDGFADDYDGEDEGESSSQEAERRQEMVENMERQMEEYDRQCEAANQQCGYCFKTLDGCWCDEPLLRTGVYPELSRAVFEYNSVPTADPNVRVAYNVSHTLPEDWREIVSRGTN